MPRYPSLHPLKLFAHKPVRQSGVASLNTSAAVPNSGIGAFQSAQGASATTADLVRVLDDVLDHIDFDGKLIRKSVTKASAKPGETWHLRLMTANGYRWNLCLLLFTELVPGTNDPDERVNPELCENKRYSPFALLQIMDCSMLSNAKSIFSPLVN